MECPKAMTNTVYRCGNATTIYNVPSHVQFSQSVVLTYINWHRLQSFMHYELFRVVIWGSLTLCEFICVISFFLLTIRLYQNAVNVTVQLWTTGNECSCDRQVGMPSIGVSPLQACAGLVWLSMSLFKDFYYEAPNQLWCWVFTGSNSTQLLNRDGYHNPVLEEAPGLNLEGL